MEMQVIGSVISNVECDPKGNTGAHSAGITTLEELESLKSDLFSVSSGQAGDETWPIPDELGTNLPPVPQFDLDLMPASLRPLVEDTADRMQVPLEFPAAAAVAALGGVCGRRAVIQPKALDHSWIVVPNLWGAIVGNPGVMKSPIISAMMKPIRVIESNWRQDHEEAVLQHEAAQEIAKLKHAAWAENYKRALKNSTELPDRPGTEQRIAPAQRRLWTGDTTSQKLHELMEENPGGIILIRDELSGWLAGLEQPGRESDRAFFLEAWNGDTGFTVDRIGRGSIYVENCCASVFGGIQPSMLRTYLTQTIQDGVRNDGLMQRFQILVWPDMQRHWTYRDIVPNAAALEAAMSIFERVAAMDPVSPLRLKFDGEAQELFIAWITDLEREKLRSPDLSPLMIEHLAKYRSLMPALALLFSIADGQLEEVDLTHAQQAAAWCSLLESHAQRVYSPSISAGQVAATRLGRKLLHGWNRAEGSFTIREVYRNQWTGLCTPAEARAAVLVLEAAGWIRPLWPEPGLGRPAETCEISPKIGEPDEQNRLLAALAPRN